MATKQVVLDDLDGTEGAETRFFAVGDQHFEIDLTETNWTAFQKAVRPFSDKARPGKARKGGNGASDVDPQAVRAWAQANGIDVNQKGRISAELVDKYKAAQVAS